MDGEHHPRADAKHAEHRNPYLLTAVGAASATTLAPYVLPLLGIGDSESAQDIMHAIGGHTVVEAAGVPSSYGTGLAGTLASGMAQIPFIGGALTSAAPVTIPLLGWTVASGTLATLAATAGIGIGGVVLANWLEKRETPNAKIHWSKVIRYAALSTSALIALPSILSGISMGIAFLALAIGGYSAANHAILGLQSTLGATSMTGEAASGMLGMILPHLLTCGTAMLPVLGGFFLGHPQEAAPPAVFPRSASENAPQPSLELVSTRPTAKGQPTRLAFRLIDKASGHPLTPQALATTYTHKLHTMVVDRSLTDYQHLHPVYDAQSGLFTCEFTPRLQQPYRMWQDFTRQGDASPTYLKTDLPHGASYSLPPIVQPTQAFTANGLQVEIYSDQPLEAGQSSILTLKLTEANGRPARLGPIMGAYAHLVGFSRDGEHLIHCHPMTTAPDSGILQFDVAPEHAGLTKFFLQINHDGQDLALPFGQAIKPPGQFASRQQGHHAQAMAM